VTRLAVGLIGGIALCAVSAGVAAHEGSQHTRINIKADWPTVGREYGRWELAVEADGSIHGAVDGVRFSVARLPEAQVSRLAGLARCVCATPQPALPPALEMYPSRPPGVYLDVRWGALRRRSSIDAQGGRDLAVANAWPTLALLSESCGLLGNPVGAECRLWLRKSLAKARTPAEVCPWLTERP
jgi:hypothetical protein